MINNLTDILGCKYPIIQTAMGWVATPELVAATSNAGAFGFLALATSGPEEALEMIEKTLTLTNQPFGINFHMFQPGADQIVAAVIKHKIKAVSYSRSPIAEYIQEFKKHGVICIPTVGALKHALKAEQLGADALVIQGSEGGGHTGSTPTTLLLSSVLQQVNIPVIAAGGFRDGAGLAAALAWGADGIAMGTRFMMTQESPVPSQTKESYLAAGIDDIKITKKFDGLPHRLIFNNYIEKIDSSNPLTLLWISVRSAIKYKQLTQSSYKDIIKAFFAMLKGDDLTISQSVMAANSPAIIQKAMVEGFPDEGAMPSGQIAGLISNLPPCDELVKEIMNDFNQSLTRLEGVRR
ncbi:nitronate monooxygenase [Gammaproteobacteria bacterium]|nr:nitronate monooxygenase [Gammaproteobacteria bacterium]MDA8924521.1 nitronate monooxygenase [Gammaproteobacteria bacterium]MDA9049122.1 nitronate monooxygenase [Gammaproteobacteria bacterium]MDA9973982.1 nitronate monooxygenase [Gammaproteobacteria bacterium]MDB9700825.1 nitronate monooxygenase [Gammaproteobacteria bacterium]